MGGTVIKTRAQILREEGEERGKEIGKEMQAKETAINFYEMGLSIEQIAQGVKYPVEVIEKWLGLVTM